MKLIKYVKKLHARNIAGISAIERLNCMFES